MQKIDFYVELIDNFWDLGFAYNVAIRFLEDKKGLEIRFFSNNKDLYLKLWWGKETPNIEYFDLSEIVSVEPSKTIINFFDRKINYDYLYTFPFEINLINSWYFSIHEWTESLHLTTYTQKNVKTTHFIPSVLPNTWWVIINRLKNKSKKESFPWLSEEKYQKKWVSVFVYPETFLDIKDEMLSKKDCIFFVFDDRNKIEWENIIQMPFMQIEDYYDFLGVCDKNIVRWENSFIQAIIAKKPYLWDIYKENNDAHFYKVDEFWDFLGNKDYKEILRIFNLENFREWFLKFMDFENDEFFISIGNYVLDNCDYVKKIEKLVF